MKPVGFFQAIKLAFAQYTDFSGRSRRSEFWWFALYSLIGSSIVSAYVPDFLLLWSLLMLIPNLSLCVRRLHDVGRSGRFLLWILLPFAGIIVVLLQFCKDSDEANQWGSNPKTL